MTEGPLEAVRPLSYWVDGPVVLRTEADGPEAPDGRPLPRLLVTLSLRDGTGGGAFASAVSDFTGVPACQLGLFSVRRDPPTWHEHQVHVCLPPLAPLIKLGCSCMVRESEVCKGLSQ